MEVCRWEYIFGVAVDFDFAIGVFDDDIVIDVKVWVVVVFVFSGDVDG